jgi:hypothetical protein
VISLAQSPSISVVSNSSSGSSASSLRISFFTAALDGGGGTASKLEGLTPVSRCNCVRNTQDTMLRRPFTSPSTSLSRLKTRFDRQMRAETRTQHATNKAISMAIRLPSGRPASFMLPQYSEDGLQQACKMGLEGIVSKRLSAPYRSGPSRDWLKVKNPDSPAMIAVAMGPRLGDVRFRRESGRRGSSVPCSGRSAPNQKMTSTGMFFASQHADKRETNEQDALCRRSRASGR